MDQSKEIESLKKELEKKHWKEERKQKQKQELIEIEEKMQRQLESEDLDEIENSLKEIKTMQRIN